MSQPDERSSGKLTRIGQVLPVVEVDCSSWERSPSPRSQGKLVNTATHLPPVTGEFVTAPAVWLELVVSFEQDTPPAKVIEHANRLIVAARTGDPGLGLTYDPTRSRAEHDDVVIALSPREVSDVEKRLNTIAEVIRGQTAHLQGIRRLVATVAHAA